MKSYLRIGSAVLAAMVLATPVAAQEDEAQGGGATERAPDDGLTARWTAELGYWVSQPLGLEYDPASRANPTNAFDTAILEFPEGTHTRPRVRVGYRLKNDMGEFVLTYWSQADIALLSEASPGSFIYGEIQALPLSAGAFDDGLADAFEAEAITSSRDLRLDFYRIASDRKRLRLRWLLGFRRVYHERRLAVSYFALAPNLPPPVQTDFGQLRPDLFPDPDRVNRLSKFEGRGVEAGLEARLSLTPGGRVWFETGFAVAGLRGDLDTTYSSVTHLYVLDNGTDLVPIEPPYVELDDPNLVPDISQAAVPFGVKRSGSMSATVIDAFGEVRWNVWRSIEMFAGFRNLRYADAGADIHPTGVSISPNGLLNFQNVSTETRSAIYEGFYFGATAHF